MTEYIGREASIEELEKLRMSETLSKHATYESCAIAQDAILRAQMAIVGLAAADVVPASWISVKDKLPEPETEVLAVCVRNGYRFICPVIYEDGTKLTQDSMWNWYEMGNYGTYSETYDDYLIPEGWWENRHFTPDDVYNNLVDCEVTHWMLLPEVPKVTEMEKKHAT